MHGTGKFLFADRFTYEGEFREGKPHGYGVARYPNGHEYDGYWKDGFFHGTGTMRYGTGSVYKGEWRHGKRHGDGVLRLKSGFSYAGQWMYGRQQGRGEVRPPRLRLRAGLSCTAFSSPCLSLLLRLSWPGPLSLRHRHLHGCNGVRYYGALVLDPRCSDLLAAFGGSAGADPRLVH